jgi:hypothetical protein
MRDMTDAEIEQATKTVTARICAFLGQELDDRALSKMEEAVKDHRQRLRLRGLNYPELAILAFPKLGSIDVILREQTMQGIETIIVNLTRKYPSITREDIAFGIGRAFPEYIKRVEAAQRNKRWGVPELII